MKSFFSEHQSKHAPALELQNGELVPHAESQARVDAIRSALNDVEAPTDFGLDPILAVHEQGYVDFLGRAHADWIAAGRPGDAFPYVFPIKRRRPLNLKRIDAELGQYAYDCGTPVAAGTWDTVYWSAQSALSALEHVLSGGARLAFAFCRPPGHHAGPDYMGGYSYLNNAAICVEQALAQGASKVAVLDVDYHHGNGTQDVFYAREDVLTISLHADPKTDYPFYWGHADEVGEGQGAGFNLNLPMPRGTVWADYEAKLSQAIDRVLAFSPDLLIVPYGADTYAGDPISYFSIETAEYTDMARLIARLDLPTLICMEGGYAIDALGANVAAFLKGFEA
ncbi:MAG: histone deacetylase family protein [Pseudomonadota bacterium]